MNNCDGVVSGYAKNILMTKGEIVYREPYIFPEGGLKSSKIHHRSNSEKYESNKLKVYPNPSRDYIIIEYALNTEPENAMVMLYDATGKTIRRISINATHDWMIIPINDLTAGNYLCSLYLKGEPIQSVKFIILK